MDTGCLLDDRSGEAALGVRMRMPGSQGGGLATQMNLYTVFCRDAVERIDELHLLSTGDGPGLRKIPLRLLIKINEAHNALFCAALQVHRHGSEGFLVERKTVFFRQKDRVIPPDDGIFSDNSGKCAEDFQNLCLRRDIRLDIPSIRGDCHVPELPEGVQLMDAGQHRGRILGAEGQDINHRRIEQIAGHLLGLIGVAHQDIPFPDPVVKPGMKEGRNVGAASGIDNHCASL